MERGKRRTLVRQTFRRLKSRTGGIVDLDLDPVDVGCVFGSRSGSGCMACLRSAGLC